MSQDEFVQTEPSFDARAIAAALVGARGAGIADVLDAHEPRAPSGCSAIPRKARARS